MHSLLDYQQLKISSFGLWDLYLHKSQFPYLGRCYAAALRKDANTFMDMEPREMEELCLTVIPSWHKAVSGLFGDFLPNIAFFGNEWRHLHAHLIPRFQGVRNFYGMEFRDPNPAGNYSPYPKREMPLEVLLEIKREIRERICK